MDMVIALRRAGFLGALLSLLLANTAQETRPLPERGPNFGPGGPGGPRGDVIVGGPQQETKVVKQFDKDGDKRLNAAERKAAREWLSKERAEGRAGRGFGGPRRGPGGFGGRNEEPPKPGAKIDPAEVQSFSNAPLYDPATLRTFFLEFENADWENELADFNNTDVEIPAELIVDGKTYNDVGVHFRGMSSYFTVGEGRKRSLNLSLDFAHENQNLLGYRTLNLLNSHEDPTFLRAVLYYHIAREYLPAPKANFIRLVINGENWGIYPSVQQFNKEFANDWFGTTKGARWKVPGSPGGRGSLAYLGDDPEAYKRHYEIKSKDTPKAWSDLARLCKMLNETPAAELEQALAPLLDIDGALKFLALENALINNDGYWIRTSDYSLYQDEKGKFHVLPHDANETFTRPGGPGFGGPGMMLAPQILAQADKNADQKLARNEFMALAAAWFGKLDPEKKSTVSQEEFIEKTGEILPPPPGFAPPGDAPPRERGPRGGFGPGRFIGPGLFAALDANKDGSLTRDEMLEVFTQWFDNWDSGKTGSLTEEKIRDGLTAALPRPNMGGPGARGPGSNMPRVEGVKLDPLVAASDPNKPLISKLLAVPALRAKYLGYVREIAEKWLDWEKLGPLAKKYHSLIAAEVKADTRKLDSTEDFIKGLTDETRGSGSGPMGGGKISLKNFADQRRAYLLDHPEIKVARK